MSEEEDKKNKVKNEKKNKGNLLHISKEERNELMEERLQRVRDLLSEQKPASQIKKTVAEEFGLSPRSVEHYIADVRKELLGTIGRSKEELRAEFYNTYMSIINNPESKDMSKIKALEGARQMLALDRNKNELEPNKEELDVATKQTHIQAIITEVMQQNDSNASQNESEGTVIDAEYTTNDSSDENDNIENE